MLVAIIPADIPLVIWISVGATIVDALPVTLPLSLNLFAALPAARLKLPAAAPAPVLVKKPVAVTVAS